MEETRLRWYPGEFLFGILFVAASVVVWWGMALLRGDASRLWIFSIALVLAAAMYSILVAVDGTHTIVRRSAAALACGSVTLFAFKEAMLFGIAIATGAALLLELGAVRVGYLRSALRRPGISLLSRRGLPFYFSSVSVIFAAAVVVSPLPVQLAESVIPEKAVRWFIEWSDPAMRPIIGFSLRGTIDDVIANAPGITSDEQLRAVRSQLAARLGIPLEGEEDVASILAKTITREFMRFQGNIGYPLRIGFLVVAFFLFRFLALPFTWAAILVLVPLLWLVRTLKIAVDIEEPAVRLILRWHRDMRL